MTTFSWEELFESLSIKSYCNLCPAKNSKIVFFDTGCKIHTLVNKIFRTFYFQGNLKISGSRKNKSGQLSLWKLGLNLFLSKVVRFGKNAAPGVRSGDWRFKCHCHKVAWNGIRVRCFFRVATQALWAEIPSGKPV